MRRSAPASSCLLGLGTRKRSLADLTPETPSPPPPPVMATAVLATVLADTSNQCAMVRVIGKTPGTEPFVCKSDNPEDMCKE